MDMSRELEEYIKYEEFPINDGDRERYRLWINDLIKDGFVVITGTMVSSRICGMYPGLISIVKIDDEPICAAEVIDVEYAKSKSEAISLIESKGHDRYHVLSNEDTFQYEIVFLKNLDLDETLEKKADLLNAISEEELEKHRLEKEAEYNRRYDEIFGKYNL